MSGAEVRLCGLRRHVRRAAGWPLRGRISTAGKHEDLRMTTHNTGTREEWLAARLALLREEKELTRRSDELAERRQQLPWVRIDQEYRFDTDDGSATLGDLFRGRSQLLVY